MDNDYDIANEDGLDFPLGDDEVASCIDAVLAHEGVGRPCMVSVSVVSDERIREVNAEWRDVDAPTDVVSLECERPDDPDLAPGEPCELGDIILAPAYIAAQAARFGTTAADECRLLLVHGTLHLLGHDHLVEQDAVAMEALEDKIRLGHAHRRDPGARGHHAAPHGGGLMIPGSDSDHPSFLKSFLFAVQGFRFAVRSERNIKVMLCGGALAVVAGLVLQLDPLSWGIIFLCCGVVISAELVNTAIETVVDLVSPEFHPLAGRAKDIAAAAVWVLSLMVALAGLAVFANALLARL